MTKIILFVLFSKTRIHLESNDNTDKDDVSHLADFP